MEAVQLSGDLCCAAEVKRFCADCSAAGKSKTTHPSAQPHCGSAALEESHPEGNQVQPN